jgi:GAF domain-containing protein
MNELLSTLPGDQPGSYRNTIRYALAGAVFGLAFPIVATVIMLASRTIAPSLRAVLQLHFNEPLLWIIDTAPLFLAIFAALAGRRQDRLERADGQLNTLITTLEERVRERTREIERAVRIGQNVAQLRDLDQMLAEAMELIRVSFNVYYAQAYLTDVAGRNLVLRAGSGALGNTMVNQQQRLPIGQSSIVGVAAARRQPVVVPDTSKSPLHRPNPLLPDTRSEAALPLLVGSELIGVLDVQSDGLGRLRLETLPALETVAGQLAIAVQHTRSVAEATQARAEIETQARRQARRGWLDFLDAIERGERLGATFDQVRATPLLEQLPEDPGEDALQIPIKVAGYQVGEIQVQPRRGRSWSHSDMELTQAVAEQVARQVESLRLLAEADRYRTDAERATRRLTREGWEGYLQAPDPSGKGYLYDGVRVRPLAEGADPDSDGPVLAQDLTLRGVTVGRLEIVEPQSLEQEAAALAAAVADQLSAHLENLRLNEQRERALAQTELQATRLADLNQLSQELATAATLEEILALVGEHAPRILPSDLASMAVLSSDGQDYESQLLHGYEEGAEVEGVRPLEGSDVGRAVAERRVVHISGAQRTGLPGIESLMVAPLRAGGRTLGTLNVGSREPKAFDAQDERLLLQMASLLAATLVNRQLYGEAERRAEELAVVNRVARAVSRQLELDQLLETVRDQVERALEPDAFHLGLYDPNRKSMSYPIMYEAGRRTEQPDIPLHPESYAYQVIHSGEPVLHHVSAEERVAYQSGQSDAVLAGDPERVPASLIFVPLTVGQRVFGVLSVQSFRPDAYSGRDLDLLTGIASYVAVALENARLFQQTQAQARRERILREVTARVRGTADVESVMRTAAKELGRALGRQAFVYIGQGEEEPQSGEPAKES